MNSVVHETPSVRAGIDWSVAAPLLFSHLLATLAPFFVTRAGLVIFVVSYALSGFGVTVGAHRYFTHESFATSPWMERVLTWFFLLSGQGSPLRWVRDHRVHHAYSDGAGDPHSPHVGQASRWRGFWHAQLWWLIQRVPTYREEATLYSRFCRDFKRAHPYAASFHETRRIARFHLLGIFVTYAIGALIESHSARFLVAGWYTGVSCVVWGIGLRSVFALHVTSLVNSATHLWGSRMYETKDHSVNNAFVAVLSLGEGWHNNHHRHAWAANHGFHSVWQLDASFVVIYALGLLGVIWNVKVYDPRTQSRAVLFARASRAEPSAS